MTDGEQCSDIHTIWLYRISLYECFLQCFCTIDELCCSVVAVNIAGQPTQIDPCCVSLFIVRINLSRVESCCWTLLLFTVRARSSSINVFLFMSWCGCLHIHIPLYDWIAWIPNTVVQRLSVFSPAVKRAHACWHAFSHVCILVETNAGDFCILSTLAALAWWHVTQLLDTFFCIICL